MHGVASLLRHLEDFLAHQPSYSGCYTFADFINMLLPMYIATPSPAADRLVSSFKASIDARIAVVRTFGVNYLDMWSLADPNIRRLPLPDANSIWNSLALTDRRGIAVCYCMYLINGDSSLYHPVLQAIRSRINAGLSWHHPLLSPSETSRELGQVAYSAGVNAALDLWERVDPATFKLLLLNPTSKSLPIFSLQRVRLTHAIIRGIPIWFPQLQHGMKRLHLKRLSSLYPYTSLPDKQHSTTRVWSYLNALLNCDWRSDYFTAHPDTPAPGKDQLLRSVNLVLGYLMVGSPQPLVLTALMICVDVGYEKSEPWQYMTSSQMLLDAYPRVMKNLKDLSTSLKRCSTLPNSVQVSDHLVTKFMYWELACGRALMLSDWQQEYQDRCTRTYHISTVLPSSQPPKWRADPMGHVQEDPRFYELLTYYMSQLLDIMIPARIRQETFKNFLARQSEWMTSGSSSGETVTVDGKRLAVNKRGWGETMDIEYYSKLLYTSDPIEEATGSEKMESGKARAIYGTKPLHYIISAYATDKFEERLRLVPGLEKGVSGLEGMVCEIKRASLSESSHHLTMLDFANFNIQHSPRAQAVLHEVSHQLGPHHHAPVDWLQAHSWLAKSKANMWVEMPDPADPTRRVRVRVWQGLYSGTKTTDLTNTALNWCYVRIAAQLVAEQYALQPISLYSVHQGDDIWLSNLLATWSDVLFYSMNSMGFNFAPTKQMIGSFRGEYLRVLSTHGHAIGYLARAIVNMLIKPIQQAMPLLPSENLSSINTAIGKLSRRGLPTVSLAALHFDLSRHWRKLRAFNGDASALALPLKVVYYPTPLNGLDCPPPGTLTTVQKQPLPQFNPDYELDHILNSLPHKMTSDWLTTVVAKVGSNHPIK